MSLQAVARKDFHDTVRSRGMVALVGLFSLLVALFAYVVRPQGQAGQFATELLLSTFVGPVLVTGLVPLVGVVVGYNAVSGERESGSLKLLLSLPHSRADVVFGKVLGRSAALALAVFAGFLLPATVLVVTPVPFNVGSFLGYTVFAAVLGAIFVSIAVGCSAALATRQRALIAGIGIYVGFVLLWGFFTGRVLGAFQGPIETLPVTVTSVRSFLDVANPTTGIGVLANGFLADQLFTGDAVDRQISAVSMLVFWALAPPLAGLWAFDRADL